MNRLKPLRALTALLCISSLLTASFAQPRPALETDARLDKPIMTRAAGVSLKTLLQDWSKQSGVSLSADAAVREYRAFARLTNRSLREAMRLLAEAFGFEWRAERDQPDAPPRYVLFAPPKAIQPQNLLRNALTQNLVSLLQRAVLSIPDELLRMDYDAFCSAVGQTPSYALYSSISTREPVPDPEPEPAYAPLVEPSHAPLENYDELILFAMRRNALLEAAQNSESWLILHLLRLAPPSFWAELARARSATLPLNILPDAVQRAYERAKAKEIEAQQAYERSLRAEDEMESEPASMTPEDAPPSVEGLEIELEHIENLLIAHYIPATRTLHLQLCTPEGGGSEMRFNLELELWQIFEPDPEDGTDALSEAFARVNHRIQPISDPHWARALRQNYAHWLSYALIEGLESAGLDGIGEFYPLKYYSAMLPDGVTYSAVSNLADLLINVRREYVYREEAGCYVFRARARPLARLQDVPEYLLTRWTQLTEPSLEWAADIASRLDPEQIQSLRAHRQSAYSYLEATRRSAELSEADSRNSEFLASVIQSPSVYWLLRWYAQLPSLVQKRLQRGEAVAINQLPLQAREAMVALLETQATVAPCFVDVTRPITELLQCPTVTIQLSYEPDATIRQEEFDEPENAGAPPRRVRYTEQAQRWTFTVRGEGCPSPQDKMVKFMYQVLKRRSLKPVENGFE